MFLKFSDFSEKWIKRELWEILNLSAKRIVRALANFGALQRDVGSENLS